MFPPWQTAQPARHSPEQMEAQAPHPLARKTTCCSNPACAFVDQHLHPLLVNNNIFSGAFIGKTFCGAMVFNTLFSL